MSRPPVLNPPKSDGLKKVPCSCGSLIVFIKTPAGRKAPCDPEVVQVEPVEAKDSLDSTGLVIVVKDDGTTVRGRRVEAAKPSLFAAPTVSGRISHFATCKDAARFRRPRTRP